MACENGKLDATTSLSLSFRYLAVEHARQSAAVYYISVVPTMVVRRVVCWFTIRIVSQEKCMWFYYGCHRNIGPSLSPVVIRRPSAVVAVVYYGISNCATLETLTNLLRSWWIALQFYDIWYTMKCGSCWVSPGETRYRHHYRRKCICCSSSQQH